MEENINLNNDELKEEKVCEADSIEEVTTEEKAAEETNAENTSENQNDESVEEDELDMMKKKNAQLQEELDSTKDRLLRLTAEYDNYRKRTTKEKEGIYSDAYVDVVKEILPVIDNLERAIAADGTLEDLKKGVEMTMKGCQDAFSKLGIEEIDATG
ncbi:MAG: nucleotide exchange factor GrpE, partial [Clostridium sp.]|nr:nucleotide exchange factor GrpE [Clostridium sp.]